MNSNEELVMIEARSGFFESVRHCLVGLQHVAAAVTPIDKYLVSGSHADETPGYIQDNSQMDITPLLHHHLPEDDIDRVRLRNNYHSYDILGGIPSDIGNYTSLDNSQLQAVHRVLTKEMAIVQGPPGTGKTFTSVQALQILVKTHEAAGNNDVIIVAAETNHAVDQILTQLLKFDYNIVRIGGRTKDEDIKKHNMFNLRRRGMPRQDKDMAAAEAGRKRSVKNFENTVKEVFPYDLLDPQVLHHHKIITKDQLDSLLSEESTWQAPLGRPAGVMSEWLGDALVDLSSRREADPVFNTEEVAEDDDIDTADFELDLDDPTMDTDDEGKLRGDWVRTSRKWGGANPLGYKETNLFMKRELQKADFWGVEQRFRGPIYEHWQNRLLACRKSDLGRLLIDNARKCKSIKIGGWKRDVACIRRMDIQIIGCTVTGLNKYRGLLAALKPKTILIEEAAQTREANITAALYPSVEQLILVGDHQQLVPHCDVPGLSHPPYNLCVSMFQRLVEYCGLPYTILTKQRRMIPTIREVLNPFYPGLGDHPVVLDAAHRPPVPGMPVPSYLFHHTWSEGMDMESLSKFNENEALMILKFFSYLLSNGVASHQITVLTFYRGQRKRIIQIANRLLKPVFGVMSIKVHTVDSYQGEENDIVLLSLVRSNKPNRPGVAGFVEDNNRGVVSISRARCGFYIFGNIVNLENATAESAFMWGNVRQRFERLGRYDPYRKGLPIRCQNHHTINYIQHPDEFEGNHGGCWQACDGRFDVCGHACDRLCHPLPHDQLICSRPCERKLPRCGHGCSEICGEECVCALNCLKSLGWMAPPETSLPSFGASGIARKGNLPHDIHGKQGNIRQSGGVRVRGNVNDNQWANFNARIDDAHIRQRLKPPGMLIDFDTVEHTQAENVREEFRPVTLGRKGKREVGSNTPSPDKVDASTSTAETRTLLTPDHHESIAAETLVFPRRTKHAQSASGRSGGSRSGRKYSPATARKSDDITPKGRVPNHHPNDFTDSHRDIEVTPTHALRSRGIIQVDGPSGQSTIRGRGRGNTRFDGGRNALGQGGMYSAAPARHSFDSNTGSDTASTYAQTVAEWEAESTAGSLSDDDHQQPEQQPLSARLREVQEVDEPVDDGIKDLIQLF
ncbi:P-loop containing nucleoside triphosphate hydrolase protein [Xylariales sp. AK1849]|nr:P-loop containing nucleoside triphosphate hydrolase protein [Xylariales sp. AK1849]